MGSYISPNNTLTTSKILKSQKKRNSFRTIKDVLLIILSKNNGIVRDHRSKVRRWKAKEYATHGRIRKMAQVSKFIGTKYRQVLHCSVMQNTTIMFKQMRNFDKREKIFGKNKNNPLCQCCNLNYAYSAIFPYIKFGHILGIYYS